MYAKQKEQDSPGDSQKTKYGVLLLSHRTDRSDWTDPSDWTDRPDWSDRRRRTTKRHALLLAGVVVAAAAAAGWVWRPDAVARAGVRESATTQQHFKSGGERSEILLREIAETLKRIEQRLERIEKLAEQAPVKGRIAPVRDDEMRPKP